MSAVANVSHVVVSWRAPFTLDVIGVEFDVTYSLLISNVTDQSQPPRDVACDVCHNLLSPSSSSTLPTLSLVTPSPSQSLHSMEQEEDHPVPLSLPPFKTSLQLSLLFSLPLSLMVHFITCVQLCLKC